MGSRSRSTKARFKIGFLLILGGATAYYFLVYRPVYQLPPEVAYVLPTSVTVVDSPAEVRLPVNALKHGDRVEVLEKTASWARVRLSDGRPGWLEQKTLCDGETYEAGQRLIKELSGLEPQAVGHTNGAANLRVEPSRDAPLLAQLPEKRSVEIFGRRLAERTPQSAEEERSAPSLGSTARDAWYLVRTESQAGWLNGRLVALDIPEEISPYAQNVNLVAWLRLSTVEDEGRQMPQYLVVDRIGTQDYDFNHIRVFTWWAYRHQYATAYVESNLIGYFPIRMARRDGVPHFRLRLVGPQGRKYQKVYGVYDTIVRPLGTVDGWESDALPARAPARLRRRR